MEVSHQASGSHMVGGVLKGEKVMKLESYKFKGTQALDSI